MRDIIHNTTGFIGKVFLRDSSTGLGKSGVAAASMSGDYCKDDNAVDIALSFSAGLVGDTYVSGKWAEIGNGYYFYHFPNGCWTTLGETGFSFRASGVVDYAPKFRVVVIDQEDEAWQKLLTSAGAIVIGAVETTTTASATTAFSTTLVTDQYFEGRTLLFTSGALLRLPVKITSADLVSSELSFTVQTHAGVAMPVAPSDGDTFIIV